MAAQTSPATQVRTIVTTILAGVFPAFTLKPGRLHPGHPGGTIGVYPDGEMEGKRVLDQNTAVKVQIFLPWVAQIRTDYVADAGEIEAAVELFREAFYSASHPFAGTAGVWDLRLARVDYEPDPVGQITRATLTIVAIGQNFAETTA